MPHFKWSEDYSVGDKELDSQHQEWLAIINRLHDVMVGDGNTDLQTSNYETLCAIRDYGEKHFQYEEEVMRSINFPDYDHHKKLHDEFKEQICAWCEEKSDIGVVILNSQLLKLMRNWFDEHIKNEDRKIREYIDAGSEKK